MGQDHPRPPQTLRPMREAHGPPTVCRMARTIPRRSSKETPALEIGQILEEEEGAVSQGVRV